MISVPKANVVSELIRRSVQGLPRNGRKCQRSPIAHIEFLGEDIQHSLSNHVVQPWINKQA